MAFGQSKEVSWKVLGGDGAKRDLRRRREEKAAPLDKGWGEDMGKALNSSPKANFRGEQRGYNLCFGQGWQSGERMMAWNGGGVGSASFKT